MGTHGYLWVPTKNPWAIMGAHGRVFDSTTLMLLQSLKSLLKSVSIYLKLVGQLIAGIPSLPQRFAR